MKLSKQNCWLVIQIMMIVYLIISSCRVPDKPLVNENIPTPKPVIDSPAKNISFTTFPSGNIP